jgi:hypothetical protein
MADFTPVALGVKPPQTMTLAEMLNFANAAQQYKQAQQINPLQVQRAEMEIDQAQKMNPLALKKAAIEADRAQVDLQANFAEKARGVFGGLANDPDFVAGNGKAMAKKLEQSQRFLNSIGVPNHPDGVTQQLIELSKDDPKAVRQYLKNMIQGGLGAQGQQALQTPQLTELSGQPATFETGTGVAKPLAIGQPATQPAGQPMPQASNQPAAQPIPPREQGVTPTQMQLPYPVRRAGDIRPLAPNEVVDTQKGGAYRNSLTERQTQLPISRRNLDEVIDQAIKIDKEDLFSTGVMGALTRTVKGWAGDPKYKQMSKDLANVQIANIQAQGGSMDTVAGQQLQKMANGDETYPPEVLINIARRTYSDLTNLDMQATAAAKFAQKYGDSNLNAFKRQWSANADSKVFEAMSIFENVKDADKRKAEIDKLLGNNPEQREQFFRKYNNIKKLTATGEL